MAFRVPPNGQKKLQLIALMDVVFILLIFFLVSIFFASLPNEERKLPVPTPKNEPGYAQVLIQLIDNEKFFYVDPLITESLVRKISEVDKQSMSPAKKLETKKKILLKSCTYRYSDPRHPGVNNLDAKINSLLELANKNPQSRYFVLVRCPDDLEYGRVIKIIEKISHTKYSNVQYGLVRGTIDDIRNSKSIEKKITSEAAGQRKNIVIAF